MAVSKEKLEQFRKHLFGRDYMIGIDRHRARVRFFGEVFTPKDLVDELLDKMLEKDKNIFSDSSKTFLDPTCGDGEFLAGVLYRRLENSIPLHKALKTLYGVDIQPDNVEECHRRLMCGSQDKKIKSIVERNIIQEDALKYFGKQYGMPLKSRHDT